MAKARFVRPARHEFLEAVRFYENEEPGLGTRFGAAVEEAALRALSYPLAGTQVRDEVRRVLVRAFPFAVVYRQVNDGIVIIAVAHLSRRPDYWNPRRDL